jgi:formylglycine-generating enzyme required for sulfatase activity
MKPIVAILLILATASSVRAVIMIDIVPVGDVGNPNDPVTGDLYGGVNYGYAIGKYEVTVGQYAAFLNAVAATDTYSLYHTAMATSDEIAGIARSGSAGSYTYSVIGSPNKPVTWVSWGDAARFVNWLHNDQPTGPQNNSTTENGAYTLNGAVAAYPLLAVTRNASATWIIPTENEWYKTAYYQPTAHNGDTDAYWAYPTKTNSVPYSDQPPGATPDNTRVANFFKNDGINNGYDDGLAVTGSISIVSGQNYLTDVGAYASSPGYFGTFDQGGNVFEWNETLVPGGRGMRGGAWGFFSATLHASDREYFNPAFGDGYIGFRVAKIAEPEDFGDYNHDQSVDSADYVVWRKNNGTQFAYNIWRANFGLNLTGVGSSTANAVVPEPSTALLLTTLVMGALVKHRLKTTSYCRDTLGCQTSICPLSETDWSPEN